MSKASEFVTSRRKRPILSIGEPPALACVGDDGNLLLMDGEEVTLDLESEVALDLAHWILKVFGDEPS
jgi:hypothetical protein